MPSSSILAFLRPAQKLSTAALCALTFSAVTLCGFTLPIQAQTQAQVQGQPQTQLPRLPLSAGMHLLEVQVASTFEQRATGLMFRTEMPQHEGMLFVFEQPSQQCFWMKNTLLPLSAAFIADNGRIVNIVDMKPQTLDSHCSAEPVRFVLEMNQGWFAKKGLKAGSVMKGTAFKN